jgi:hypothetical protein
MLRLTATTALAALLLAACAPVAPPEEAAPEGETVAEVQVEGAGAEAATPIQLSYSLETETSSVSSEIDPAIETFDPALARHFWTEAKTALDDLDTMAVSDKVSAEAYAAKNGGTSWFNPYSMDYAYRVTAQQGDTLSVQQTVSHYTGGAHPNYFLGGGAYQRGQTEPLPLNAFITDAAVFDGLVAKAIVDEKIERGYEEERPALEASVLEMLAPSAEQPEIYKGRFVLEMSTEAGKFGGITVLFSPYDVGSYAEGAYLVTLPAADLAAILTPEWAPRFGGSPVAEQAQP